MAMPEEVTADRGRAIVARYFEADARRDDDAILALFAEDAVVIDERHTWRGSAEIRDWRRGPVSKYEYATTVASIDRIADDRYRASGRIDGNFPGGSAALTWTFLLAEGMISRLEIAP